MTSVKVWANLQQKNVSHLKSCLQSNQKKNEI